MNDFAPAKRISSFHPPQRTLMGPGPTEIHPRVLTTMSQPAIGYLDPAGSYAWMEDMLILKGSPMAECEELINFMLETDTSIAVAEGQSYPPALDPNKVKLTDKIKALPAFDPTGTMKSLTFADPIYWADNEDAWTKQWDRISKGA